MATLTSSPVELDTCAGCGSALEVPVAMRPDGLWELPPDTLLFHDGWRCHAAHGECAWLLDLLEVCKPH